MASADLGLGTSKSFFVGHPGVTPKYIYMNSSVVVDVNIGAQSEITFLNDSSSSSDNLVLTGLNLGATTSEIIDEAQEMISKANSSVTGNFYDYDFRFFAPLITTTS